MSFLRCHVIHRFFWFSKEQVEKCNTDKLEFDFEALCLRCSPIRWIGKKKKRLVGGIEHE